LECENQQGDKIFFGGQLVGVFVVQCSEWAQKKKLTLLKFPEGYQKGLNPPLYAL